MVVEHRAEGKMGGTGLEIGSGTEIPAVQLTEVDKTKQLYTKMGRRGFGTDEPAVKQINELITS